MLIFSASFLITLRKLEKHSFRPFLFTWSLPPCQCNVWPVSWQSVCRGSSSPREGEEGAMRCELYCRQSGSGERDRTVPAVRVSVSGGGRHHPDDGQAVRGLGQDLPLPPHLWPGQTDPGWPSQGLLAPVFCVLRDGVRDLVLSQDWTTTLLPLSRPPGGNTLPLHWTRVLLLTGNTQGSGAVGLGETWCCFSYLRTLYVCQYLMAKTVSFKGK